jgi:hypothetical protein
VSRVRFHLALLTVLIGVTCLYFSNKDKILSLHHAIRINRENKMAQSSMNERFSEVVEKLTASQGDRSFLLDRAKLEKITQTVLEAKDKRAKKVGLTDKERRRLKVYDVIRVNSEFRLIRKLNGTENGTLKYFAATEDMFQILSEAHAALGHRGRLGALFLNIFLSFHKLIMFL